MAALAGLWNLLLGVMVRAKLLRFFIASSLLFSLMFAYPILVLNSTLVILNSTFCSVLICMIAMIKMTLPTAPLKAKSTAVANGVMCLWATINAGILSVTNSIEWDIEVDDNLRKDGWYLLICNHLSWSDIVVLCCVFIDRIPMPKFFL